MGDDWACDSCTFVNSGFLPNCELCSVPRTGVDPGPDPSGLALAVPGPQRDDPIVLSDGEIDEADSKAAADVINWLRDTGGAGTAKNNPGVGASRPAQAARGHRAAAVPQLKHDPDITIIDDNDDDGVLITNHQGVHNSGNVVDLTEGQAGRSQLNRHPQPGRPTGPSAPACGPVQGTAVAASRQAANTTAGAAEFFTLDTCSCASSHEALAAQLRPAVAAAAVATAAAPATTSASLLPPNKKAQPGAGGEAGAPPPTLLDLTAPLVCPSPACRCGLSSRDVRLLLGPRGAHVLSFGMCAAVRREAKASKAVKPHPPTNATATAGSSGPGDAGKATAGAGVGGAASTTPTGAAGQPGADASGAGFQAGYQAPKRHRGRRSRRGGGGGGAAGGASPLPGSDTALGGAGGGGPGAAAAAIKPPEMAPLRPLAPSCPGCSGRMVPCASLSDTDQLLVATGRPPQGPQEPAAAAQPKGLPQAPLPLSPPPPPGSAPPPALPKRQTRSSAAPGQGEGYSTRSRGHQHHDDHAQQQQQQQGLPSPGRQQCGASGKAPRAPSSEAPGAGSRDAATDLQSLAVQLRAALTVRGRQPPAAAGVGAGTGRSSAPASGAWQYVKQLRTVLRATVAPRCAFVCLGCAYELEEGALLPSAGLQELQAQADAAAHALKLLRKVRALLLSAQEDEEEDGEGGDAKEDPQAALSGGSQRGGGGGGGGQYRSWGGGGKRKRGRSHGFSAGGGQAWAKGVGYGGSGGGGWGEQEQVEGNSGALRAAQERQQQVDEKVRVCLVALLDIMTSSRVSSGAAASHAQLRAGSGGAGLAGPSPVLLAALQYGGLPYALRLLLQNDSLLDMGQRQRLYGAVMQIIRHCANNMSLLELLAVPAADPRDAPPPTANNGGTAGDAETSAANGAGGGSDPPLCSVFENLARQCSVFKRSAQELADGTEDDIAALGLALELGTLAEEVAAGVAMWRHNLGGAAGILSRLVQLPAAGGAAVPAGGGAATAGVDSPAAKRPRRGAVTAAGGVGGGAGGSTAGAAGIPGGAAAGGSGAAADGATALASRRHDYLSRMRPLQFREVSLLEDHYYRREVGASGAGAGGEVMRKRLKRITGEISGLSTGLPLEWDAAAFVAVDDTRVDVLRALLIPASDTPYANGAFIFDIYLTPEYPNKPPQVQFLTTGGGKVRFNPNLYAEGKVCLSLLGTWSGPSWDPNMSTVLQVLVSIQSMILVSDPYYNEPGWERQAGTAAGRKAAQEYSNTQRYNTLAFSILPALKMITGKSGSLTGGSTFRDVLLQHYKMKVPELLKQCGEWQAGIAESAGRRAGAPGAGGGGGEPPAGGPQGPHHQYQGAPGGPEGPQYPYPGQGAPTMGPMAMGAASAPSQQETLYQYTMQVVPQIQQMLLQLA